MKHIGKRMTACGFAAVFFLLTVLPAGAYNIKKEKTERDILSGFAPESGQKGIVTDDYSIWFSYDAEGNLLLERDGLTQLQALLDDQAAVEKVVADKAIAQKEEKTPQQVEAAARQAVADIKPWAQRKSAQRSSAPAVLPAESAVARAASALTNFAMDLNCYLDGISSTFIRRQINLSWSWDYSPVNTLQDVIAIAWSNQFSPIMNEASDVGFIEYQVGYAYHYQNGAFIIDKNMENYNLNVYDGNEAYTSVDGAGNGIYKEYDIKKLFTKNSSIYVAHRYGGMFIATIGKSVEQNENQFFSVVGKYFHQKAVPAGSIGISGSGPSVSISFNWNYTEIGRFASGYYREAFHSY